MGETMGQAAEVVALALGYGFMAAGGLWLLAVAAAKAIDKLIDLLRIKSLFLRFVAAHYRDRARRRKAEAAGEGGR